MLRSILLKVYRSEAENTFIFSIKCDFLLKFIESVRVKIQHTNHAGIAVLMDYKKLEAQQSLNLAFEKIVSNLKKC